MYDCPFMEGWRNKAGWLVAEGGRLVCLDWNEYCTLCRVDDSKDVVFEVIDENREEAET